MNELNDNLEHNFNLNFNPDQDDFFRNDDWFISERFCEN